MDKRKVRVRFAPSPTGPLHIGGVRTALYNFLFARKNNGVFILRIEDTDQTRFVPGAEEYIIESLKWCGITIDEGIEEGGPYGPYRQSDRKELYKEFSQRLIDSGNAYYAFDTAEELEAMRERLKEQKNSVQQYNAITRGDMKNSLTLSETETNNLLNSGAPFVIRFKMPDNENVLVEDIVRGTVSVNTNQIDDKVLFKSDGMPTYHLANVVDDHLMKISHVIRGEEWLPSLPLHVLLYRAFGWESTMPEFAHLPLLLKPSGQGKLSKRDGDALGFPVFPLEWTDPGTGDVSRGYREDGYFPDAFVNMLAFLGWNPGTEEEILSLNEMAFHFDLTKVHKAGAKFDPEKAKWFNHKYLTKKNSTKLANLYQEVLKKKNIHVSDDYVIKVVSLIKERANFVSDFWDQSCFFFQAPQKYDQDVVKKRWKEETPKLLSEIKEQLEKVEDFDLMSLEKVVHDFVEEKGIGMGQLMNPLRLTLVGAGIGPGVLEIMELLGKEEALKRIRSGIEKIN
ncbi:MAG: glutamate--tRNA ligase [Bacteroidetes bacterium GWC2_33_15]|nr:MAG: glutamate--tRNA ligase [Bacteroidetes bacterium GWA2_33_15]OFX49379.1 MAG: glutamate--tRNA ligase [Bacteroidetes bacterium GWC2_33_15]OFX63027.1 MAG: glutamate--tRNA ligase [Bacteroidetes bacterium GWB2_32_14]OFX68728.1 MAG: glutamate--tRNA ligase [Bacteroidetes bacterium GWD2_33_33]HAN19102.1 glutamate--tRNA ligase [Bacteroidales bacterium]